MYDIEHKYNKDLFLRWVPRMRIKAIPKGHDEMMLKRMEGAL